MMAYTACIGACYDTQWDESRFYECSEIVLVFYAVLQEPERDFLRLASLQCSHLHTHFSIFIYMPSLLTLLLLPQPCHEQTYTHIWRAGEERWRQVCYRFLFSLFSPFWAIERDIFYCRARDMLIYTSEIRFHRGIYMPSVFSLFSQIWASCPLFQLRLRMSTTAERSHDIIFMFSRGKKAHLAFIRAYRHFFPKGWHGFLWA